MALISDVAAVIGKEVLTPLIKVNKLKIVLNVTKISNMLRNLITYNSLSRLSVHVKVRFVHLKRVLSPA